MEYSRKYLLETVKELELELVLVKQRAHLRQSELEMALELAHSKAMAKD
jgi:hypothetical protein